MNGCHKIAFLGYGPKRTLLVEELSAQGHRVTHIESPVEDLSGFDRVVSFGYRHILRDPVLATAYFPILNLHISLLPYNRGAHPNFWAWVEGTPHGVTLHELTRGVDTGPIVAQRKVLFDSVRITLRESRERLIQEIEALFLEVAPDWLCGRLQAVPQSGPGSEHRKRDLPDWMTDWDMSAEEAIRRYRNDP